MHDARKQLLMEIVERDGQCTIRVGGTSMGKTIRHRAVIDVHRTAFDEIHAGDIVAYFMGNRLMVHRIIEKLENELVIRGDSEPSRPHRVAPEAVLGRVTAIRNPDLFERLKGKIAGYAERFRHSKFVACNA